MYDMVVDARIDAVLFELDGTLVLSPIDFAAGSTNFSSDLGRPVW